MRQLQHIIIWIIAILFSGLCSGLSAAIFLIVLDWITAYRSSNSLFLFLLPPIGFLVSWMYFQFGSGFAKGNNLILEEIKRPTSTLSILMAPFVLIATWLSHLGGASVGREGTAIQMGSALTDQFSKLFGDAMVPRDVLLMMGISTGFAAVFGTPFAGTLFALEIAMVSYRKLWLVFPLLACSLFADKVCRWIGASHAHYPNVSFPPLNPILFLYVALCGFLFGLIAWCFVNSQKFFTRLSLKISYPPLRTFFGGFVLVIVYQLIGTRYCGLGIDVIQESFTTSSSFFDFSAKLLLTSFAISVGFKGGEVTPLFFIGATFGSALALIIPLPLTMLAALGFVAVFAGATHAPLACTMMAMELFGAPIGLFSLLINLIAYFSSGREGIYTSQAIGYPKRFMLTYWDKIFGK